MSEKRFWTLKNIFFGEKQGVSENKGCPKTWGNNGNEQNRIELNKFIFQSWVILHDIAINVYIMQQIKVTVTTQQECSRNAQVYMHKENKA